MVGERVDQLHRFLNGQTGQHRQGQLLHAASLVSFHDPAVVVLGHFQESIGVVAATVDERSRSTVDDGQHVSCLAAQLLNLDDRSRILLAKPV